MVKLFSRVQKEKKKIIALGISVKKTENNILCHFKQDVENGKIIDCTATYESQ